MNLREIKRAIKSGKVITLRKNTHSLEHIALFKTFTEYIQEEKLKELLIFQCQDMKEQIITFNEFCSHVNKVLLNNAKNVLFIFRIMSPNPDMPKKTEKLLVNLNPEKFSPQDDKAFMNLHIPEKEWISVELDDELWQETIEFLKQHLQDFLDQDTNFAMTFQLWRIGLLDEKNLPLEREKKKCFTKLISDLDNSDIVNSFVKADIILRVLQFKKLRYRVQHDAIKIAISGRKKADSPCIELLQNGHIESIKYYLDEEEKKPLGLYHYIALFDLILRVIRQRKIKNQFAVAKSNQKIPKEYEHLIITNETIRTMLGVDDREASKIKKAIYDLTKLVIVFEKKDGTKVGIFPIRRRGFLEKTEERFDFFEIDTIFLHNGKNFIPMIPNSFTRLQGLKAPSRTKEFITNVFLYLLQSRNFSSNACYISAQSFSEVFPNSYSKKRRWKELHQKIGEALQFLYESRLIRDYKEQKSFYEVNMRS